VAFDPGGVEMAGFASSKIPLTIFVTPSL
jgi:hypothetical protein